MRCFNGCACCWLIFIKLFELSSLPLNAILIIDFGVLLLLFVAEALLNVVACLLKLTAVAKSRPPPTEHLFSLNNRFSREANLNKSWYYLKMLKHTGNFNFIRIFIIIEIWTGRYVQIIVFIGQWFLFSCLQIDRNWFWLKKKCRRFHSMWIFSISTTIHSETFLKSRTQTPKTQNSFNRNEITTFCCCAYIIKLSDQ